MLKCSQAVRQVVNTGDVVIVTVDESEGSCACPQSRAVCPRSVSEPSLCAGHGVSGARW